MSLLLDARKKSQEASLAQEADNTASGSGLSQEVTHARNAGQSLFDAKRYSPYVARASINRNLLIALSATLVLLAGGTSYVWYEISGGSQPTRQQMPPRAVITQPPIQIATAPPSTAARIEPPKKRVDAPLAAPKATVRPARKKTSALLIKKHKSAKESINTVLNNAYQAYLVGDLDKAQPMYHKALKMNVRNSDALLGLAAIAQRNGSDNTAAYYYSKVLELDPRDPVANAGMSGLTISDNTESQLKKLLHEQQDSSALHFALGNQYAAQDRWADAQQSYFNAYKLDPKNAQTAFNLGVSLDRLGQKKFAAPYYRSALELDSQKHTGFDHAQISSRIEELTH